MKKLETTSTVLLKHHLKALKLPTMTAECEKVAARCARENVDHLGFLLQLCELELLDRERRAAQRRLKAARFPTPKALDGFDFAAAPSVNKPLILELMRCEYLLLVTLFGEGCDSRRVRPRPGGSGATRCDTDLH
jgi:DNA replication protein DnaC